MNSASPVFIVGCPRSGTTLLRAMLNAHSKISIPPESDFLIKLFPKWRKRKIEKEPDLSELLEDLYSNDKFSQWGIKRESLEKELSGKIPFDYPYFINKVYSFYSGGKIWGDKNPQYIYEIERILKIFPKARFIHIIRDGRGVFSSHLKANKTKQKQGIPEKFPKSPYLSFLSWKRALDKGKKYYQKNNYLEVKYERLLFSPEKTLRKICEFLGIDFEDAMTDYYKGGTDSVPVQRKNIHKNISKKIDVTRISAWKEELPEKEILKYELVGSGKLKKYGYSVDFSLKRFFAVDRNIFYFFLKMFFYKLPSGLQSKIEKVFSRK